MGLHLKSDQSRELICDECRTLLAGFDDEGAIRPTDAVLDLIGGEDLAESPENMTNALLENLNPEMTDAGVHIDLPCPDCDATTGLIIETNE
jgi:hypothetical protein